MKVNRNFIFNIISIAIMIYGISMVPSLVMAYRYNENELSSSMFIIVISCITAGVLGYKYLSSRLTDVQTRIYYITTIITWVLLILLSTIPYLTCGRGYSFIDCLFESTASWTTTGACAIANSDLPLGLKLWRASCNWMGGIGIILLTLAFLPRMQFIGQRLASTEIRGPNFLMSTITFRKAYRRILMLYSASTLLQYVLLRFAGMTRFMSLLTALSNTSTSGLQHLNGGIIVALSAKIKIIITVFAFLSSLNVGFFIAALAGKGRRLIKNSELNLYTVELVLVTLLITVSTTITNGGGKVLSTLGNTLMQVISFISTAGYIVAPCNEWNSFSISLVTIVVFIGACAISTGGGIKMSRAVYAIKTLSHNVYSLVHPHSIKTIYYNDEPARSEDITETKLYISLFLLIYICGSMLLALDGYDVYSALNYSQAMLTNLGTPILAQSGAVVSSTNGFAKVVMSFLMICGRLEIYPVLMLFSVNLWTRKKK
ncbi:MAG: TrkH family potassium uptake protein [Clostridiales bacterium]|nr:TrkH family potassium uptake protein [Candidatus Crickella caballi]